MPLKAYLVQRMKLGIVKGKLAAWTIKRLKADNDNVSEETTTGFAGLAPENAEDYTALVAQGGEMQAVAQGQQADNAEVPAGANSVSVQGSAGTSVSLAAPSLGTTTTRGGGIIVPQCTRHSLSSYYATDHLGTVRFTKTIDETGAVTTTTHDYEPFGVEIAPTDECDNTHRFTGHERDTETGNDYMHFRFFSSNMGRFQKPDSNFDSPLSNPQGWNLYSYVHGNPVNYNDPTGHWYRVSGMHQEASAWRPHGIPDGMPNDNVDLDDYLWGGAQIQQTIRQIWSGGNLLASWVVSENQTINVNLNVVVEQSLTAEQRASVLEKFSRQLEDANTVWGKLGIHLSAGQATYAAVAETGGSNFNKDALVAGKINIMLTDDLPNKDAAGGKMVEDHTYAILMLQNRTGTDTLTHELGHAFGVRGKDFVEVHTAEDLISQTLVHYWYEAELDTVIARLRTVGAFGLPEADALRQGAAGWE